MRDTFAGASLSTYFLSITIVELVDFLSGE